MKTQPAGRTLDLSSAREKSGFSKPLITAGTAPAKSGVSEKELRVARRDALSFSICFAIIAVLTGLMLLYKVAVTMSAFTSAFFYLSLGGMLFFAVRAVLLSRQVSADTDLSDESGTAQV